MLATGHSKNHLLQNPCPVTYGFEVDGSYWLLPLLCISSPGNTKARSTAISSLLSKQAAPYYQPFECPYSFPSPISVGGLTTQSTSACDITRDTAFRQAEAVTQSEYVYDSPQTYFEQPWPLIPSTQHHLSPTHQLQY
jgi:hypothetical protein